MALDRKIVAMNWTSNLILRQQLKLLGVLNRTKTTAQDEDLKHNYMISKKFINKVHRKESDFKMSRVNVESSTNSKNTQSPKSRVNELNIQMLSHSLYQQIFGNENNDRNNRERKEWISRSKAELLKHGLWTDEINLLPDVNLKLPKLEGKNIEEHFWNIGKEQSEPYKVLMTEFVKNGVPEAPKTWLFQKGWTRYVPGKKPKPVPYPYEDALVLDVEVCLKVGESPTLAVAVSSAAWYGWVSNTLIEETDPVYSNYYTADMMIPIENPAEKEKCKIIIGHNVSFDRSKLKEQYSLNERSALRFMDTMSLHTCIGGASKAQKTMMKSSEDEDKSLWKGFSCFSSLKEVYAMYCNKELSKEERSVFLVGTLQEVRDRFQVLMDYCASDVLATYEVFQVVFPIYTDRFPHPVTLAGMLEMGMPFLPVNSDWVKYIKAAKERYDDSENEINFLLAKKCDDVCRLMKNEEYKNDLWMWSEDWTARKLSLTQRKISKQKNEIPEEVEEPDDEELQELTKKFKYLFDLKKRLPIRLPHLPGYPAWYTKLCEKDAPDWKPGPRLITPTMMIVPKVLKLTFENYPLHVVQNFGWGILVADPAADVIQKEEILPFEKLKQLTLENSGIDAVREYQSGSSVFKRPKFYKGSAVWCHHKIDDCCYFLKLPHRNGDDSNVGQPLSKSFSSLFERKLSASDSVAQMVLEFSHMLSYWRGNRDRISNQMIVWLKETEMEPVSKTGKEIGVILPKLIVCGTLTRRAVEPTWLTASKSEEERLGSELRSMVQAPPGYHIVGADVDSQELWIASLIGDASCYKIHGGTPFGWMTIKGTKLAGTDMHSVTADAAGISREHAKVINYARIYGAGVAFAQKLLQRFNPSMTPGEIKQKINKMYELTKGKKVFKLKKPFALKFGISNGTYDLMSAYRFAKQHGSSVATLFEETVWEGGTESAMFNKLESIANSKYPVTPFLQSRLSRALEPRFTGDNLCLNTRTNWVVQSGAVDFLHLLLVCMRWLTKGEARFCLSFHDEVRYLVPSDSRYKVALALQISNLLTRAFMSYRLGIRDLPLTVAFFSSVEVDKVMRKEAFDDCITPSNPHGLEKGYGIPKGESLNIYQTIKKSGGTLTSS